MQETIFRSRLLCPDTWLIQGEGCNSYLVVGDKCGVVIDTGFATENIQAYAQTLTDKPVMLAANTHGHFDHTGGNGWFTRAYMSAKAAEIAKIPYPSKQAFHYPLDYPITIVGDGDEIDLGNRSLLVIEIPAHSPTSIAFLDRKERILFTGDEADAHVALVWIWQDEPQPTVEQHALNMEKLLRFRKDFDFICGGHNLVMANASLVEDFLEHDRLIMSGVEGEPWVPFPDAPADFHMPQPEFKRVSVYKGTSLIFDVRYVHNR